MVIKFSRLKEIKIWTVSCGGPGCTPRSEIWTILRAMITLIATKRISPSPVMLFRQRYFAALPLQLLMMYFVLHSEWGALCRRPEWRNIGQFRMMYRQAIFLQMSVLVFAMVCNGAHLICKNQIVGRNFRIGAHLISSNWISVKFSIRIFWVKD